ncbi:DUF72 domain-containing protein [Paenarthrobacter sp. PH39-S1]|uniref:DUF72 domain-containing protein n=1 Tax=Paenarthrobacter sp. PH39-S1 TaxID=3046204 RepID=UPI0024B90B19|nr:DUF72 domain-containing protein [Paenarthrobacter sp. PH39-S1]MDJ0355222.1 DUF72 domain-containing protein [Paenarthrobacter sp. PH39-S1]
MSVHIGTSGWSYDHWNHVLYPPGTAARDRLGYYFGRFGTVELNASFYRWPRESTFAGWRRRLPEGFLLSVKAPRGLTHGKKLYAPEVWIDRIARSWHELGDKRAVLLVQLPPDLERDDARLGYFLTLLPTWVQVAVEFRHHSWNDDAVYALLEHHQAAYCVMSGANLPCVLQATAPFVYVRMHGPDTDYLYGGSYSEQDLRWWAERIRQWQGAGKDVYVYFNNDGGGNAVRNADTLRAILGEG